MSIFDDAEETTEEHERRIVRCSSCRARIVWLKTAKGRNMPVDADTVKPEDTIFQPSGEGDHISPLATCPNADKHRKKR